MGCTNSHGIEKSVIEYPFASIEKTVIPLTEDQIKIVYEKLGTLSNHTRKKLGSMFTYGKMNFVIIACDR